MQRNLVPARNTLAQWQEPRSQTPKGTTYPSPWQQYAILPYDCSACRQQPNSPQVCQLFQEFSPQFGEPDPGNRLFGLKRYLMHLASVTRNRSSLKEYVYNGYHKGFCFDRLAQWVCSWSFYQMFPNQFEWLPCDPYLCEGLSVPGCA